MVRLILCGQPRRRRGDRCFSSSLDCPRAAHRRLRVAVGPRPLSYLASASSGHHTKLTTRRAAPRVLRGAAAIAGSPWWKPLAARLLAGARSDRRCRYGPGPAASRHQINNGRAGLHRDLSPARRRSVSLRFNRPIGPPMVLPLRPWHLAAMERVTGPAHARCFVRSRMASRSAAFAIGNRAITIAAIAPG